jgi:predicted transcriptional regulator
LSRQHLTSEASITQKALSQIESDKMEPRSSTIFKIAEAPSVEPSVFSDAE